MLLNSSTLKPDTRDRWQRRLHHRVGQYYALFLHLGWLVFVLLLGHHTHTNTHTPRAPFLSLQYLKASDLDGTISRHRASSAPPSARRSPSPLSRTRTPTSLRGSPEPLKVTHKLEQMTKDIEKFNEELVKVIQAPIKAAEDKLEMKRESLKIEVVEAASKKTAHRDEVKLMVATKGNSSEDRTTLPSLTYYSCCVCCEIYLCIYVWYSLWSSSSRIMWRTICDQLFIYLGKFCSLWYLLVSSNYNIIWEQQTSAMKCWSPVGEVSPW